MDISIRGVVLFLVGGLAAYIIGMFVPMPKPLRVFFWGMVAIAAALVLLHAFGIGPGVHVH